MERLDIYLHSNNYYDSRERAKNAIKEGCISVNGKIIKKPSFKLDDDSKVEVVKESLKYVSRGALKLIKALEVFDIEIKGKVVLDIGASTGGFTEVCLENNAKLVYALDVGKEQLHHKIKSDPRVISMEQTNFRYSKKEDFIEQINFSVIDVSFISLTLILNPLRDIIKKNGDVIALIKPQFEAGKAYLNKKGIIKDPKTHQRVINDITEFASSIGFEVMNITDSPILGGDGNKEYLVHLKLM